MNTEVVFIIIVVFLVADFIVERILEWVNMRAMAPVLPENLKGIYDEKEYARFQNYKRETIRFALIILKKNMHVFRIISAKRIVSI